MTNNDFPRFVQNRPNGLDKFEGASQTKLAKAIAQQIIGIRGTGIFIQNNEVIFKQEKIDEK